MVPKSGQPPNPSWFTPKRLLIIFCVINLINYVDRGAIASNGVNGTLATCTESGVCTAGTGIQGDFNLSNFQDGVLSSAFMVGLLIASPIFASLAKSHNPFRLIGVGLSVWTFAVAGCGSSFDFWSIAICRMLVGVGEASFISLAAPFIDDNAPVAQKTAWLATFYMCIPAGTALGYVYGGLVGSQFNWRVAFWGEFIFMETSERPNLNQALESLHKEFKDDDNIKFVRSYDEALSHLLFAGSDIILCRSFHDPTDETPLKALRYGAVPIAVDSDSHTNRNFINHDQEATKYSKLINNTFGNMSLGLAIDEIRSNPSKWKRRIMEAIAHDLSWDGECYEVHVAAYSAIKNM